MNIDSTGSYLTERSVGGKFGIFIILPLMTPLRFKDIFRKCKLMEL